MTDIIVYTAVFAGYAVCRIRKAVIKKKKVQKTALLNFVCTAFVLLFTGIMGFSSRAVNVPKVQAELPKAPETVPVTETKISSVTSEQTTSSADISTGLNTETTSKTSETVTESKAVTENSAKTSVTKTDAKKKSSETTTVSAEDNSSSETETPEEKETVQEENQQTETVQEETPVQETTSSPKVETTAPVEPETIYRDGTYSVTKFGYDSDVNIIVTIENDIITEITASCNESDMYYFDTAYPIVKSAILAAQSPDVDAVSGATYSSEAIIDGVREALSKAKK